MLYAHVPELPTAPDLYSPSALGAYLLNQPPTVEPVYGPKTRTHYSAVFVSWSYSNTAQLDLIAAMKWAMLLTGGSQWWEHVFNPRAPTDVDSITKTVEGVLDFIAAFGPESLSLRGLQPESVQGEHLAALLRASSTWCDQIAGWHEGLNVAQAAIAMAGEDPRDALFGMI